MEQIVLDKLRGLNRRIAILTGVVLLACAVVVLLDILLRRLGSSLGGTDEISGYVMAIATSWGMAFTLLELGHVRIDILRSCAFLAGIAESTLARLAKRAASRELAADKRIVTKRLDNSAMSSISSTA